MRIAIHELLSNKRAHHRRIKIATVIQTLSTVRSRRTAAIFRKSFAACSRVGALGRDASVPHLANRFVIVRRIGRDG